MYLLNVEIHTALQTGGTIRKLTVSSEFIAHEVGSLQLISMLFINTTDGDQSFITKGKAQTH